MVARLVDRTERMRQQIEAQRQHQENMIESVSNFLMTGEYEKAAYAIGNGNHVEKEQFNEFVELFYKYAPKPEICPICSNKITYDLTRHFSFFKTKCHKCELKEIMDRKKNGLDGLQKIVGVPKRYRTARIEDFSESFRKVDFSKGAFFYGSPGTGKTHLMAAIFNKFVLEMQPISYIPEYPRKTIGYYDFTYPNECGPGGVHDFPVFQSVPEILSRIKGTFNQQNEQTETEEAIVNKYSYGKVLFLDDIGSEYSTEWAIGILFLIIDRRYNEQLPTFITSNLSLEELSGRLNDRLTSRIAGMCKVIKLSGKDRRVS